MRQNKYSISVIVPVYNESTLLEKSLTTIDKFLSDNFAAYEIIIIESGSTDGSLKLCDTIAASKNNMKVIHEGARKGFGSALKLGYKSSTKDLVWLVTLDLPFPLSTILQAIPLFSEYDCILSYRSADKRKPFRKIQSFVYNNLTKLLLGIKVKHVNSAFKVFKRETIQNLKLISNGWFIDAEIICRLKEKKISFTEIPVPLIDRTTGLPSVNLSVPLNVLKEMIFFMRNKKTLL